MLSGTVTGKVIKVDGKNVKSGRETTVFWLNERRFVDKAAHYYTWIVIVPTYLEGAVERLVKEGKSIGVTFKDLWAADTAQAVEDSDLAAVVVAEQIFIL